MTWLGKILAFVVLIASIVGIYFSVQAYVTRTNWKTAYDKLKNDYKQSLEVRNTEFGRHQSSEDALRRLYVNEQTRAESLQKMVDFYGVENVKFDKSVKDLQATITEGDVKATLAQANVDGALKQVDALLARNTFLEDQTTQRVLDAENAKREMVKAQNETKLAKSIAEDNAKKVDELQALLSQYKSGGLTLRQQFDKPPPPVLSNLRGEVERVEGDLVVLSIGVDAGLSKGTVLDLSRLSEGRYLGTVKVTDLFPKQAIAVFKPARSDVPFAQLRPEELPKKGDQVKPLDTVVNR